MSTQTAPGPEGEVRLVPKLRLLGLVVFGVSYMAPMIVVSIFGVIAEASRGATPTAYAAGTVAMLLTGVSYGTLARRFPEAGSVYTYASRLLGGHIGFLSGWALLLDYFFLPAVAWLIQSLYLNVQFPAIPVWGWLVLSIVITTAVNIVGIVVADRVNRILLAAAVIAIVAVIAVAGYYASSHHTASPAAAFWSHGTTFGAVMAGAAITAYSFLGFDAVSTLSEETHDARRNIPRGIVLTVLVGGLIFVATSLVMQWAHPGFTFHDVSTAGFEVDKQVGGKTFADIVNTIGIIGGFASCIAVQASTSRLMYVMGRDGVFPRKFFGYLHPRFRTPVWNLVLVGVVAMFALKLSLDTATSFINFGAFLAFVVVNLCVLRLWAKARPSAGSNDRRATGATSARAAVAVLGAIVDGYLLTKLSHTAILLGLTWLLIGVGYLVWLTRGFRKAPPRMHLDALDRDAASEEAVA